VFGMTLDYFNGDYFRTGTNIKTYTNEANDLSGIVDLYNGNIKAFRWRTRTELTSGSGSGSTSGNPTHNMYGFNYDALSRMTKAQYGPSQSPQSSPTTTFSAGDYYKLDNITYDRNGNIKGLSRNAYTGTDGQTSWVKEMDDFTYHYKPGTNQLVHLNDDPSYTGNWSVDLDDQGVHDPMVPATWNYQSNESGQLVAETGNSNYLDYNLSGKVTKVYQDQGKTILKASYDYNERGSRIKKTSYDGTVNNNPVKETWYVHDASGGIVAVYEKEAPATSETLVELPIYASGRLGSFYRVSLETIYELTDHLGNVRATINRTKQGNGDAQLLAYTDYYPFGMEMPGRSYASSPEYRFSFQGQEFEDETGWSAFDLRMYDARLGRWMAPDPYEQHFSPYLAMSNNPISFFDPNGGEDEDVNDGEDEWDGKWNENHYRLMATFGFSDFAAGIARNLEDRGAGWFA
ncbi:MAG: RHS repeat-associated core domain-containing protein, partial [Bacteroidota bacterium]